MKRENKFFKTAVKFITVLIIFAFLYTKTEIGDTLVFVFYLFFICIIWVSIFDYHYAYKRAFGEFLFASGILKSLFLGKISSLLTSLMTSAILAAILLCNLASCENIIFICIALPLIFFVCKILLGKILVSHLNNPEIFITKWTIFLASSVGVLAWFILNVSAANVSDGTLEFKNLGEFIGALNAQIPNFSFKSKILNEIYSYSFYSERLADMVGKIFLHKYKILILLYLAINNFLFFYAILHIVAFVFKNDSKGEKSYFLSTIFVLAYLSLVFILAFNARQKVEILSKESFVKIALQNGEEILLNADKANALKQDLNASKIREIELAKNALDIYVDAVFENSAKEMAKKTSKFHYSFISDYLVLWHGVVDGNSTKFLNEKLTSFLNESFPENFDKEIERIIAKSVENYQSQINNNLLKYTTSINFNSDFLWQHKLNRVNGGGIMAGSAVLSKILLKTFAKTASKASSSLVAAESGLICGAGAIVCVPALAVATWFGFDYIFAKGDEMINKENFEKQIYDDMMRLKFEFKKSLNTDINTTFNNIENMIFKF